MTNLKYIVAAATAATALAFTGCSSSGEDVANNAGNAWDGYGSDYNYGSGYGTNGYYDSSYGTRYNGDGTTYNYGMDGMNGMDGWNGSYGTTNRYGTDEMANGTTSVMPYDSTNLTKAANNQIVD